LAERLFSRTDEEREVEEKNEGDADRERQKERDRDAGAISGDEHTDTEAEDDRHAKPIFLKGLFSVATTSTKSASVIKADIRRVLDRMQVQYREIRNGFECVHVPSIDLSSVEPMTPGYRQNHHHQQISSSSGEPSTPRPTITKKSSKLSFSIRSRSIRDRDASMDKERDKEHSGRPSGGTTLTATPSTGSSSFFNVSSNHTAGESDVPTPTATINNANGILGGNGGAQSLEVDVSPPGQGQAGPTTTASPTPLSPSGSTKSKMLPPIPRDFGSPAPPRSPSLMPTGEVDREVFETMGNNSLSVRFEINVVKVPWLPLHGIQFRRAGGDGWQYQMLARRVLTELKL
jgi:serine/threonine protein kinase KIN1/2